MKTHLWAVLLLTMGVPAWAAPDKAAKKLVAAATESLFDAPLPVGCRASLHFERTKVAVGAINSDCHQSDWWIEVRDAKGKPKSGVTVDLPFITKGGQGPSYIDKAPDNTIRARLQWLLSTKRADNPTNLLAKQAVTGADGRARGRFTSGFRTQKVEFAIVGGAKASILQVWNEVEEPYDDYADGADEPVELRYTMRFFDGQKWVPITGHHLRVETSSVRMNVSEHPIAVDGVEDDQGEDLSDIVTFSEDRPEEIGWKTWLEWWKPDNTFVEVEPGVYVGHYRYRVPEGATIGGRSVDGIETVAINVCDDDGWDGD